MYEITERDLPIITEHKFSFWICKSKREADICKKKQVPYLTYSGPKDNLMKYLIYPIVTQFFPDIRWKEVWGFNATQTKLIHVPGTKEGETVQGGRGNTNGVSDIAQGERRFDGTPDVPDENTVGILDFVDDPGLRVDVERLMNMELMPMFMTKIVESILKPLEGTDFMEGYNKKRGLYTGNYKSGYSGDNLIILDVSASIPAGVASTMLAIIAQMAERCNADLIVTGAKSFLWLDGEEIPSPEELRRKVPRSNESRMFHSIIEDRLDGRDYEHVICFGDGDSPCVFYPGDANVTVANLHCYHMWSMKELPGYCRWVFELGNDPVTTHDNIWCKDMKGAEEPYLKRKRKHEECWCNDELPEEVRKHWLDYC